MADRQPILIVGGGIGGLAAALALARIGWPVRVAERRPTWSEAGAGIQLSPNGVAVLERLGIAAALAPAAGVPDEIVVRDAASARPLQRLPLGSWLAGRHGAPYWQVHRRDLQAVLLDAVRATPLVALVPGFEATHFLDDGPRVRLVARSGASLEGVALIGADGVFSRVRQQLWGSRAPRFSGATAARTVIAAGGRTGLPAAAAGLLDAGRTGVWLAPGSHIVHYPVRGGREIAVVVVRREAWREHGWSAPVAAPLVEGLIRQAAPELAAALGEGHDWHRWALFELEPLARWSKGRASLVGDAAHPTLPFLAQGGSLALEDAWTLAASIGDAGAEGDAAMAAALAAYERARLDRTRRVVAAARRNGRIFHLSGAASLARNAVMRLAPGERVLAAYDWVYGWKPG